MGRFNIFLTGDLVPASGLYKALHSTPHKLVEREICLEGAYFRRCGLCPLGVVYRLENPSVQYSSAFAQPILVAGR